MVQDGRKPKGELQQEGWGAEGGPHWGGEHVFNDISSPEMTISSKFHIQSTEQDSV